MTGVTQVSRKKALRKWKLAEKDLEVLENDTVIAKRRCEGLLYPLELIKQTDEAKAASDSVIDSFMIPEVFVQKQLSRKVKHVNFNELRILISPISVYDPVCGVAT